jgi:signal transduction histidine kinase
MPQKQKDQVIYIMDGSRQLHNMFTDLLTHIQLNSGEMTVENKPFSTLSLLTNVSERIYKNAAAKGLSVSTEVDPALPVLLGDEPLLKHALDILASNAVKFTQKGSINLAAQLLDKTEDKVHVAFAVKDSGIGIPLERQHELFRPFEPLDASLTRPYSGMGLGLSICAQLVKLLGGELDVESSIHSGSLFRMKVWLTPCYGD